MAGEKRGKRSRPSTSQAIGQVYGEHEPERYNIQLPDRAAREAWNMFYRLSISPTKYPKDNCLRQMGIFDDVWMLFGRVGWTHFMKAKWPTYTILVLEFLSMFIVDKKTKSMSFQLGNMRRHLTVDEFNQILKVPSGGFVSPPSDFDHKNLWSQLFIDDERYVSNASKASSIQNPVFCYIQRVMSHNIFGRDSNSGVTVKEVFAIHCMFTSTNLDVGYNLMEHFNSLLTSKTSVIHIGGFITPIAEYFKFEHSYKVV